MGAVMSQAWSRCGWPTHDPLGDAGRPGMTKRVLKVGLTLLAGSLLVAAVGWHDLVSALGGASLGLLGLMYVSVAGARMAEALQMASILSRAGAPVGRGRVVLANSLSAMYSLIVPGDVVASGAKWMNLAAATGKWTLVLNAIVYNRLALLFPALVVGAIALLLEDPFTPLWVRPTMAGILAGMLAAMILLWHPKFTTPVERFVELVARPLPRSGRRRVDMLLSAMRPVRAFRLRDHLSIAVLGLAATAMTVGGHAFAYAAVPGVEVPILSIVWLHAVVVGVRQLPITIGGLGVREGLLVVLLAPYGVEAGAAVALGLVLFTTSVVFAFVGATYQFALTVGWAQWGDDEAPNEVRGRDVRDP